MKNDKSTALLAITAAAFLLQGTSKKAEAVEPTKTTFGYKYSQYNENPIDKTKLTFGSADRYAIDVHQFSFKTAMAEGVDISINGVQESMSGASPWYIIPNAEGKAMLVMSGATIDEERSELELGVRKFTKSFESALSIGYSKENDYRSFSFGYAGTFHFDNNLTTLDYGINKSKDYIDATDAKIYTLRPTGKVKNRLGMLAGVSHVFTKNTLIGISVSYSLLDGFLSDTYKLVLVEDAPINDSRPDSNGQLAGAIQVREFFPSVKAALHLDYRVYSNDWGLDSDTIEASWYQNLGAGWQLIPSVRQYQQTAATFYQPFYTATRTDGYYSNDYRLSEFTAVSGQLKLQKTFEKFVVNIAYEEYEATGDNPALISYNFFSLGINSTF